MLGKPQLQMLSLMRGRATCPRSPGATNAHSLLIPGPHSAASMVPSETLHTHLPHTGGEGFSLWASQGLGSRLGEKTGSSLVPVKHSALSKGLSASPPEPQKDSPWVLWGLICPLSDHCLLSTDGWLLSCWLRWGKGLLSRELSTPAVPWLAWSWGPQKAASGKQDFSRTVGRTDPRCLQTHVCRCVQLPMGIGGRGGRCESLPHCGLPQCVLTTCSASYL